MSQVHAEICRKAAEIIQTKGMCKGELFDDEGRVCMWGALHVASEELTGSLAVLYPPRSFPGGVVHDAIAARLGLKNLGCISTAFPGHEFNDLPETDEKDVAKFLMSVADELEMA